MIRYNCFTASRRTVSLTLAASTLAIAVGTPAFAQDADAEPRSNEIVVTAQFREQKLQDTPLSITAVDAALLASRNQDDIKAVAAQAPSVTLTEQGGAYGASMSASIRGVGQNDFNPAYEPGVGMYIDDVYYPTLTGANFDLLDLERVEILRGPQGTLTGRNSIGGAIKLFSKKPGPKAEAYGEASYGSRNRVELRAGANLPITDSLFARFSAVHKSQEGYVDQVDYGCANPNNPEGIPAMMAAHPGSDESCVVDKLGEQNYTGLRGSVRYEGSKLELMVTADYQKSDRTSSADVVSITNDAQSNFICGKYCTYASWFLDAEGQTGAWNTGNRNVFEGWGISGHANYEISDSLNIQSITAYRAYNNKWGSDDDFTPNPAIAAGGYNDLDFWFFSQELRLNGKIGDLIEYTLGGFYSDQKSTYYTIQDIRYGPYAGNPLQFVGNDPVNADTAAAFGTVIVRPTDSLTLTGGLRYTEEHKDYTFVRRRLDYSKGPVGGGVEDLDGLVSIYDGNRVDWRISADYRFNEQLLAYATVSTGFKGGGVTARPFYPEHAKKGTFKPETVTSYELGLKTDLFDRRLRLNVSGFYNNYKDIQLGLSDCTAYGGIPAPCAVRANAGDGEIWGVEAELFAEPIDGLTIDGSLNLLDSKYTYLAAAVGTSVGLDDPIASPTFQGSFGIQYKVDLGDKGSITPRFDVSYRDKQFMGRALDKLSTDLRYLDAYTLGNARLTYRNADEDVEVSLEVTNLFDEYYTPTRFAAVYALSGTAYSTVGAPREWRVSVKKTF